MATLAQPPQGVSTGPHLDNRRIAAALIDLVVPAAIAALAYAAGLSLTRGVLLVVIGWTLYYFFALESGDGQTLGKRVMKLRVVSADGSPASMEQIAKRTVVRILDGHIVGLIVMLASGERRQRLGDMVAGTVVTEAEEAQEDSVTQATAVDPAPRLAPVPPDTSAGESVPRHKRALTMPAFSMPSLRRSYDESKPSRPKRSLSMPSMSLPSLRKRSQRDDDDGSTQTAGFASSEPIPEMPAAMQSDPVAEVKPFEPFSEPREVHEASEPEPIESFMERDVVIERDDEPPVTYDDEPVVELDREPVVELDREPVVELDREPAVEFDREPAVELDREPAVEFDREPAVELDEPRYDVQVEPEPVEVQPEDPAEESMTIKPIETVSAIDLVMQDAEDRHPGTR